MADFSLSLSLSVILVRVVVELGFILGKPGSVHSLHTFSPLGPFSGRGGGGTEIRTMKLNS